MMTYSTDASKQVPAIVPYFEVLLTAGTVQYVFSAWYGPLPDNPSRQRTQLDAKLQVPTLGM